MSMHEASDRSSKSSARLTQIFSFLIRPFSRNSVRFTHVERFLIYSTELIFLHLFIPAIFKSLIFIRVDRYIHTVAYINRNQDVRLYYGLYYIYPLKRIIVIFSILCGFPFLVGYYSKDLIIEYFFFRKIVYFSIVNLIIGTILIV